MALAALAAAGSGTALAAVPPQFLPAREQMAFTLGFHIILVPFGVAFTFLMLIANYRGIRHGDEVALLLARRWSYVAGVLFAVGAVSGTVLSFELGLLWPGLMSRFGAAFGFPFAVEGLFFFLEAIFVAIYLYGWRRMRPWPHFWSGVPVTLSGIGGTLSVVAANGWMNVPAGFALAGDRVVGVDLTAVFFNRAFWYEAIHMLLAAYMVAGFIVAGVYAVGLLRGRFDRYHRLGMAIPLTVAAVVTPFQIFVGDVAAREVAHNEPAKFAGIEMVTQTGTHVPLLLGGALVDGEVRGALEIPSGASLLVGYSPDTRVTGLDAIPAEFRPNDHLITTVHLAFDVMVIIGFALLALALWFALIWWRRRAVPTHATDPWFLRAVAISGALAVVALEAGWVVTEVGRQPWTVVGYLLTLDAVTRTGNIWLLFAAILVLYAAVGWATIAVLRLIRRRWAAAATEEEVPLPYGPASDGEAAGAPAAVPAVEDAR
jgi:cytochrome bd ubiquinol oxidase subunit I